MRTPDLDVPFEPIDRLEVEQNLQRARLALLTAPVLLLISRGADGLPYAVAVVVGVLLSYVWVELLRRRPQTLLRVQLVLRLVDTFVVWLVLLGVYRTRGDTHLDFVFLLFVVTAAATHGQRGGLVLAGAGGLAVLATRLALVANGDIAWQMRHLTDAAFFTVFFAGTASVVALLMRRSGEVVARREQLWRTKWIQREADRQALQEYERLLDRLDELAQALGGARDRLTVFRTLRDFVLSSTPSHGLLLSLQNTDGGAPRCIYAVREGEEVATLPPLPLSGSPHSRSIATGEVVICDDYRAAIADRLPLHAGQLDAGSPRAALVAPLKVKGRVVGAFEAQSPTPAAYTREHATALRLAANLAALAIENVDHLERERDLRVGAEASERQHRALAEQRKRLFELSQATIATLSVDDVAGRMLETLRELVPFDTAGVYWLDGSLRVLRPAVIVGADARVPGMNRFELPLGHGIFGAVAQSGRGELIPNAQLDPRSVYPPGYRPPLEHMLCLPLPGREGTLGIVHAVRTADPPFGQEEFELVQLFVTHAGIAVENARLFEQARALAQTEKLRALGQMASGVAHDLNQSLALIAGYCDLALARLDEPPTDVGVLRETLGIVAQAAMNGGRTVNGLLTFARSHPEGDPEPIELRGLLDEVARLTSPRWRDVAQAEGRPIGLEVEAAEGLKLLGWPASLKAALTNLVFNAVDALPAGGTIRLDARRRGHEAIVEVSDTGVGMAPEVQARVFEPFFSTKGEGGTGLGLAMVFGVVEQHGGRISLSSAPGEGTTFRLAFPAAAAGAAIAGEGALEDAGAPAIDECPGLRVLVVDDEPQLTRVAALILAREGHDVTTAASGETALDLIRAEPFDALVSDVSMGAGMNGWELARRVRQLCPGMRIVLATGYGAAIDPTEAARRGVDAVVAKPYRARTLGETLLRAPSAAAPA